MIIHLIHYPVSAKRFVEPIVKFLNENGFNAELWLEKRTDLNDFIDSIECPKQYAVFDLSLNPFKTLIRLSLLIKRFKKNKPSVIHAHQSRAALIPLIAARITKVPVRIYHNHGTPYLGYKGLMRFLFRLLEYFNCKLATNVIAVSKSIRKKMIEDNIVCQSKCTVLGQGSVCGIDLNEFKSEKFDSSHKFSCREILGIKPDDYVVLYVGRPYKRKGFHSLLRAWNTMQQQGNLLLIVGCSQKDVLKIAGPDLKYVKALGYTKNILSCYAACDVVVLPSRHEGFPYSLLEAAAAYRTLVGCDVTGIDSIIIDKENGLLVPVEDTEQLAQTLIYLKQDPELRQKMGSNARKMVEAYFNRDSCNEYLLQYYKKDLEITD